MRRPNFWEAQSTLTTGLAVRTCSGRKVQAEMSPLQWSCRGETAHHQNCHRRSCVARLQGHSDCACYGAALCLSRVCQPRKMAERQRGTAVGGAIAHARNTVSGDAG